MSIIGRNSYILVTSHLGVPTYVVVFLQIPSFKIFDAKAHPLFLEERSKAL